MKDRLTPELRKIEKEIDCHYKSNPLVNLPFATAAWCLLTFTENVMLREVSRPVKFQDRAIIGDNFVNELKYPIYWLYRACGSGGQVPFAYNDTTYEASRNLLELGGEYGWFVSAYTYASHGWVGLDPKGSKIQPTEDLFAGAEYNAYDLLIKPHKSLEALSSINFDNFPIDAIGHSLKIHSDRFSYKLNPRIISDTIMAMQPTLDAMFLLPSEWKFSRYTLGDFRKVFEAIFAIAFIRALAGSIATGQGYVGYADSIYVATRDELLRRVVRYSRISNSKVQSIFDDLSYGNRDISKPDPALQPLIQLDSDSYAIMPHLWLSSSAERNLTVLLNKLPSEREIYAKLVDEKERLMRERFKTCLSADGFRFTCGKVQGLPDVDLAIIMDSKKTCLLLELKWFIEPAETREIIERSEEIEKGISQVLKLKQAFANNHTPLLEKLKIDSSYRLEGVVVSENWIGHAKVQSPEIPVIQANHLIAKLKAAESLQSVMEWLQDRKYLPREGEHFKVHMTTHTIGDWSLKWYEIQPLISDAFFPL